MSAAFRDPELLVKRIISWIQSELRRAEAKGAVSGSRLRRSSGVSLRKPVPAMSLAMPFESVSQV